eukprot:1897277-Alexandrium_andersonii.AAC.1
MRKRRSRSPPAAACSPGASRPPAPRSPRRGRASPRTCTAPPGHPGPRTDSEDSTARPWHPPAQARGADSTA